VSLDTSIGSSGRYDLPCGCGETHLFQVESPTLWSSTVPCTLLLFTYAHSFFTFEGFQNAFCNVLGEARALVLIFLGFGAKLVRVT
jgi:hypothetical protein